MEDMEQLVGNEGQRVDLDEAKKRIAGSGIAYFGNRLCPFCHRVFWTATELGYNKQWAYSHVDLGKNKPGWFTQINPLGSLPVLYDNGRPVFESLLVAVYINDVAGGELVPKDPYRRAIMYFVAKRFDDACQPVLYEFLKNQDQSKSSEIASKVTSKLEEFDQLYAKHKETEGPFLFGQALSMCEISVIPFLERFETVFKHYRNYDMFADGKLPTLHAALEAARGRPAFAETTGTPDYFVAAYKGYATRQSP